jgi:hypothetical protein
VVDYRVDQRSGYRLQIKGQTQPSAQAFMVTRDRFYLPGLETLLEGR